MCYSFRTSIISYTAGIISAIFAFYTRQYVLGTLILFYVQMQLSEALIWKGIDDNNVGLNILGTKFGQYLLPSHLVAVGIGYLLSIHLVQKRSLKLYDFIPLVIGIVFYFCIVFGPYRNKDYENTSYPGCKDITSNKCENSSNRLVWPYPHHFWYVCAFILFIIFAVVYIKPIWSKVYIIALFVITFFVSLKVYPKSVGSVWCFSAAILAPLLVLGNYLIIRNKKDSDILT